jgi:hypothetical protein
MQFTGQLGTVDSFLSNIVLGTVADPLTQNITDTLVLIQTVQSNIIGQDITDTLNLVQTLTRVIEISVNQSLNILQNAATNQKVASASNILSLSQNLVIRGPIYRTLIDTLEFIQEAILVGMKRESLFDSLTTVLIDPITFLPVQSGETSSSGFTNNTGLRQSVDIHFAIANISITDIISLSDSGSRGFFESINDIISLSQDASRVYTAENILELLQIIIFDVSKGIFDELNFEDIVTFNLTTGRSAANLLEIVQSFTYSLIKSNLLCSYSPFVGEATGDLPIPPPTTPPVIP